MDYKYIEQLLARYWECETTPQEESILRAFFAQENVPANLARYKDLFVYEQKQTILHLDESFDEKVLASIEAKDDKKENEVASASMKVVNVEHITLARRLRPLYRAAASVAIITLLGTSTQHWFTKEDATANGTGWDYNQSAYKDSYQDPQRAYEASVKTLELFKEGAQTALNDSASHSKTGKQPAEK